MSLLRLLSCWKLACHLRSPFTLRLDRVDLSYNRLSGAVPSEFGELTLMSEFFAKNCW
jgi:hypothetical protein